MITTMTDSAIPVTTISNADICILCDKKRFEHKDHLLCTNVVESVLGVQEFNPVNNMERILARTLVECQKQVATLTAENDRLRIIETTYECHIKVALGLSEILGTTDLEAGAETLKQRVESAEQALVLAEREIGDVRQCVLDSCSVEGNPDTMDDDDRREYERLSELLAQINNAIVGKQNHPPMHPFEVRISIGGDDWEYVQRASREIAEHLNERDADHASMMSGGGGGSHSVTVAKRDVTPEQFHKELEEWRQAQ